MDCETTVENLEIRSISNGAAEPIAVRDMDYKQWRYRAYCSARSNPSAAVAGLRKKTACTRDTGKRPNGKDNSEDIKKTLIGVLLRNHSLSVFLIAAIRFLPYV